MQWRAPSPPLQKHMHARTHPPTHTHTHLCWLLRPLPIKKVHAMVWGSLGPKAWLYSSRASRAASYTFFLAMHCRKYAPARCTCPPFMQHGPRSARLVQAVPRQPAYKIRLSTDSMSIAKTAARTSGGAPPGKLASFPVTSRKSFECKEGKPIDCSSIIWVIVPKQDTRVQAAWKV